MQLKYLGLCFVLALAALPASADPLQRRGEREAVRAFYLQQTANDRSNQQEEGQPQFPRQGEQARGQVFAAPDSSGYGVPADANAEQRRKSGRMSPEERRALRRQIDEVGHDIYAPKR